MPEKRILLVEDEPTTRDLLENVLIAEGYAVDVAINATEAAACLDQRSYTLAIVDWRLPDGDGVLVANTAAETGAETYVMSGYLFQMPAGHADRHEALMKPIRPTELIAAVERRIGKAGVC